METIEILAWDELSFDKALDKAIEEAKEYFSDQPFRIQFRSMEVRKINVRSLYYSNFYIFDCYPTSGSD